MITFILFYSNNKIKLKIITSYIQQEKALLTKFKGKDSKDVIRLLLLSDLLTKEGSQRMIQQIWDKKFKQIYENIILLLDAFGTANKYYLKTEVISFQRILFSLDKVYYFLIWKIIAKISKNKVRQFVRVLHQLYFNRIIHRNMKPQNILISANGGVKLSLLELCLQILRQFIQSKELFFILYQNQFNDHTVDLWFFGVILYELFFGQPLFNKNQIYTLIIKDSVKYSVHMSQEFMSFLKGILNKKPLQRLGWPEQLNHPFIKETDQEKCQRRKDYNKLVLRRKLLLIKDKDP